MRLHAFQGFHYSRPEEAVRLAAPPFDQIGEELREQLQSSDPHHFSHLTRSVATTHENAPGHAARLHGEWLSQGEIVRDQQPALYPYAIELAAGGRRLGVAGLVGIEPPGSPAIRPHEHTVTKTVGERLALLRRLEVDLEPILLLSDDGGTLDPLLAQAIDAGLPEVAAHRDPQGHLHRVFRLTEPATLEVLRRALAERDGVIADGHHRYRVAQLHCEETGAAPGTAAACKLAVVTSLADPALTIEPIHRRLADGLDGRDPGPVVTSREVYGASDGSALAAAAAEAPQPAIAVWNAGARPEIWTLDPEQAPHRFGPAANDLAVVLLHTGVFAALGLGEEGWTDGTIEYHSSADDLYAAVSREGGAGFWIPPMPADRFASAVAHGDLLPPKSTRFMPKLVSGLVWAGHDSELG
jgi:uncharacterized protein (DUF1015 family)